MTRRKFLASGAAACATASATSNLRVDAGRLRRSIEELSLHGRPRGGTFADGVSRVAFSDADVSGRAWVMRLIETAGLKPRVDAAGNIFARREGTALGLESVLFGSHIDSVPSGGNFDGDLGSLAAIEIIRVLNEHRIATRRPLEIVVWSCEEGVAFEKSLFGSRAAAGRLGEIEMDETWKGVRKNDAVKKIGGDPDRLQLARIVPGSFHGYLELHIEQGGTLERDRVPIGVVDGIVAIDRYDAAIEGIANHAGTTAMADRADALVAASKLVLAVREAVVSEPGRQVGTVGRLEVAPNAPNVIPGTVRHSIELRDLSREKLDRLGALIDARAQTIARESGVRIQIKRTTRLEAALAAPRMREAIAGAARSLGFNQHTLPSGAAHDAQMMAQLGPMGMIFVPSVGGISHSPREWTHWEDCARGADVLMQAVLTLAG